MSECFFWYWPTQVVPDQRPLNVCVCVCVPIDELRDEKSEWQRPRCFAFLKKASSLDLSALKAIKSTGIKIGKCVCSSLIRGEPLRLKLSCACMQLLNSTLSPLVALTVLKKICDHPRLMTNRQCLNLGLEMPPRSVVSSVKSDICLFNPAFRGCQNSNKRVCIICGVELPHIHWVLSSQWRQSTEGMLMGWLSLNLRLEFVCAFWLHIMSRHV